MSGVNLPHILASFKLQNFSVNRVYLVGSRLWGTNTESSDFDLLIVADSLPAEVLRSQHNNRYDMTLITQEEFVARVRGGSLIETVCCLLGDEEECVLQGGEPMKHLVQDIPVIDAWIASRHLVDREKAKKFWGKGKQKEASKILQHMIMAESVVRGLNGLGGGTRKQLSSITLTMTDLHGFVESGRDESDWTWYGLDWEEVEKFHTIGLKGTE